MLITAFGPPTGYTQYCMILIRFLAEEVLRKLDYIATDDIVKMRTAWGDRKHPHAIFFSQRPERAMVELFLKLDRPLLILAENEEQIAAYVMRAKGVPWQRGLRMAHQCLVATGDLILGTHALIIRREYELSLREFLDAVAGHFGLEVTEENLMNVTKRTGKKLSAQFNLDRPLEEGLLACWEHARPLYTPPEGIPPRDVQTMHGINAPLREIMHGRAPYLFYWPAPIFASGTKPNDPIIDTIEMLGPTRCLFFGPYMHLPVGKWAITLEFSVEENYSGNQVEIQFDRGGHMVRETFDLPKSGVLQAKGVLEIIEPRRHIEIRLLTLFGSIEGRITLRHAIAEPA